jgi:secreted PhoX family phosphatase
MTTRESRRKFLRSGLLAGSAFLSANMLWSLPTRAAKLADGMGRTDALQASNLPQILLPPGFRARVVARSGQPPVRGSDFAWHGAPDGGACFPDKNNGWIYVSNSELKAGEGGASALRFSAEGKLYDAYPILQGTERNCAGGATSWNTWLSCEEPSYGMAGQVYECDPYGVKAARARPALGLFCHEAVAQDVQHGHLYMTEDVPDGCLYRFVPARELAGGRLDLDNGRLEVATWDNRAKTRLSWKTIPDPAAAWLPTREQVPTAARFNGGEGCVWHDGQLFFTTKGDNRLWRFHIANNHIAPLYDDDFFTAPVLRGLDNIAVSCSGDILVAEDGDDMQIVTVDSEGRAQPLLQVLDHPRSEIAGPAFNPAGDRLYFSSQWGASGATDGNDGVTYEVTGPFRC